MSGRVYYITTLNSCKDVSIMSCKMNSEDGQVYSVCILQFSCLTKYNSVCSENIIKQIVNKADENLTDYSFLSRYHPTKSKKYLIRRYRNRH